jgi:hypothetical protein
VCCLRVFPALLEHFVDRVPSGLEVTIDSNVTTPHDFRHFYSFLFRSVRL